jgi:hypothetical protein
LSLRRFALERPLIQQHWDHHAQQQWYDKISRWTRKMSTQVSKTAAYTVEAEVYWVRVDATGGAVTITLPPAGEVGRPLGFIKTDSSTNAVTIDGSGTETISGSSTITLAAQYDSIQIRDNGTAWDIEVRTQANVTTIGGLTPNDGNFMVGNGTTWVEESGNTARTSLGLGTGDSPQFTAVNIGDASDTTITRSGGGDIAVEGNVVYRAGGTDVPITDGGTGSSTAAGAATNLGLGTGNSPQFTAVNVGHASDTTIARSASGVITVEAQTVPTLNLAHTWTLAQTFSAPPVVPSYAVAGVPSASPAAQIAYISNETGGAVLAFSDGTNWRRVTDRAIVS